MRRPSRTDLFWIAFVLLCGLGGMWITSELNKLTDEQRRDGTF